MNVLLSFDVEHWDLGFKYRGIKGLNNDNTRDRINMDVILSMLDSSKSKATFFTTGHYAEDYPDIINDIITQGHEIACHGYSHEYIYNQTEAVFKEETIKAINVLSELTNEFPKCYRAASWSIVKESIWALNILNELGFAYDSSIYPTYTHKYGMYNSPSGIYKINISKSKEIIELTPQILNIFGIKIPVANGVYMRLFPNVLTRLAFEFDKNLGIPGRVMLHPHELDENPPKVSVPFNFWLVRYFRINSVKGKINKILTKFNCISYKQFYSSLDSTKLPVINIDTLL